MQKGRIIDEIVGIVHAAQGMEGLRRGQIALDIFLCKFIEHARIVTVVI